MSRLNNPAEETIAILRCASSGPLAWGSFFHLSHRDHRGMFDVFSAHAATARVAHSKGIGLLSSGSTLPCQFGHGKVSGTSGAIRVHVLIHAVEDWETGWSVPVWLARSGRGQGAARKGDDCSHGVDQM